MDLDDPAAADRLLRGAVLGRLLELYPAPLTMGEVVLEFAADPHDFLQHDDIERAIRDLAREGLVHRHRTLSGSIAFVIATRAAVNFAALPVLLPG
jgi:hypothetical protein